MGDYKPVEPRRLREEQMYLLDTLKTFHPRASQPENFAQAEKARDDVLNRLKNIRSFRLGLMNPGENPRTSEATDPFTHLYGVTFQCLPAAVANHPTGEIEIPKDLPIWTFINFR